MIIFLFKNEESTMYILPTNRVEVQGVLAPEEQQKIWTTRDWRKHHFKIQYKRLVIHS
jgi:hypothetical protein